MSKEDSILSLKYLGSLYTEQEEEKKQGLSAHEYGPQESTVVKRIEVSASSGTGGIDYVKVGSGNSREITDSANYSDTSIRRRDSLSYISKVDLRCEPNEEEVKAMLPPGHTQHARSPSDIKDGNRTLFRSPKEAHGRSRLEVRRMSTGSQDDMPIKVAVGIAKKAVVETPLGSFTQYTK